MAEPLRVLVFGGTGTGKTSLCNTLAGRDRAADNGAKGVTSKCHLYGTFSHEGNVIELVDTVGLHEADTGTVPTDKAIEQLVSLLKHSKDGFSLLVHVSRAGRITKQHQEDYDFFVNKMTQGRIPVILVLTGCENEQPMSSWVTKNRMHFSQFDYRELVASCFAHTDQLDSRFAPLRDESREAVLSATVRHALPVPAKLYGADTGTTINELMAKLWNHFAEVAGLPDKYRAKVNESAYQFMRRIGVSKKIADLAIAHLPDLLEEGVSKLPVPGLGRVVKVLTKKLLQKFLARGVAPESRR